MHVWNSSWLFILSPLWGMCTIDSLCVEFNCYFIELQMMTPCFYLKKKCYFYQEMLRNKYAGHKCETSICHWRKGMSDPRSLSSSGGLGGTCSHGASRRPGRERRNVKVLLMTKLPVGPVPLPPHSISPSTWQHQADTAGGEISSQIMDS